MALMAIMLDRIALDIERTAKKTDMVATFMEVTVGDPT